MCNQNILNTANVLQMIKTHLYNTANILIKTQCLIKSNTQISHSQEN